MASTTANRISFALGIVVAVLFLYLALKDTDPAAVVAGLTSSNPVYIPFVAGFLMLQFWFKAQRWHYLLAPFSNASAREVFPATVVGYLANLVFPLYLGEVARVYLLGRQLNLNYSSILATAVLERFFDFLSVLFFVGLVLAFDPLAPPEVSVAGYVSGVISLILLAAFTAFLLWTGPLLRLAYGMTGFLPDEARARIVRQLELGIDGLRSLTNVRTLPAIALTSLLQWGAMGMCIYLGMLGTGADVPVSAAFVVLALTVLGVTLPSSPGFFGTIQLCFTLGLAVYGVGASEAFSASLFFHLTIYVTGWAAGLYLLRRMGLDLGGLRRVSIDPT